VSVVGEKKLFMYQVEICSGQKDERIALLLDQTIALIQEQSI